MKIFGSNKKLNKDSSVLLYAFRYDSHIGYRINRLDLILWCIIQFVPRKILLFINMKVMKRHLT